MEDLADLDRDVIGSGDFSRSSSALAQTAGEVTLAGAYIRETDGRSVIILNPKEVETLELASQGLSVGESAKERGIPADTIKSQRKEYLRKLGAKSTANAVRIGIEAGIIPITFDEYGLPGANRLTPALLDVLELAAQGFSVQETAEKRGVSIETIKTHRKDIIRKLGAENIVHSVRRAYEAGIFDGPILS